MKSRGIPWYCKSDLHLIFFPHTHATGLNIAWYHIIPMRPVWIVLPDSPTCCLLLWLVKWWYALRSLSFINLHFICSDLLCCLIYTDIGGELLILIISTGLRLDYSYNETELYIIILLNLPLHSADLNLFLPVQQMLDYNSLSNEFILVLYVSWTDVFRRCKRWRYILIGSYFIHLAYS